MWKRLLCILVLVPVLCGLGCDSTDPDVCLDLAHCTGDTLGEGLGLFDVIVEVLVNGNYNESTGAYSTSFDGVNVSGMVSEDSGDGDADFEIGEVYHATYNLSGGASGSGTFSVYYESASTVTLGCVGSPTLSSTSGCTLTLDCVSLTVNPVTPGFPTGSLNFVTSSGGDSMDGSMSFNGTSTASVDVECDLLIPIDCTFDLDLLDFSVDNWGCGL
jgi:hypothetical protein